MRLQETYILQLRAQFIFWENVVLCVFLICEAVKLSLCEAGSFFRSPYFVPDSRNGQLVS